MIRDKREIRIVIGTEAGWTKLFAARLGREEAALKILRDAEVPLTIGEYDLSVAKIEELLEAIDRKFFEMMKQGTWTNWKYFYNQMSTIFEAERFLGIALQ